MVLEKTLEGSLDSKEIKPVNPKGYQPLTFIRKTDAQAEAPVVWPPDSKNWLIGQDPDVGKAWEQEEEGTTERWDGWMTSLTPHKFKQTPEGSRGQGNLVCCSSWGCKELDMPQQLNNNNNLFIWLCRVLVVGKKMATHSSIPAWRIPWTEEPGRLQSMTS